jgi:hypothetical protein
MLVLGEEEEGARSNNKQRADQLTDGGHWDWGTGTRAREEAKQGRNVDNNNRVGGVN